MVSKFRLDSKNSSDAKAAINRTLQIANNYAGELSIEVLPLDHIDLDPDNKRELALTLSDAIYGLKKNDPDYEKKKEDWRSLESLSKTIKNEQLINPIFVYRYGNKCRLISGERRTLASAIAGKKEIIARIASQRPIGMQLRILQWIENNERSDLKLSERIASIESILETYYLEKNIVDKDHSKVTAKTLSELTGMSGTQARRYILILQSRPEIKQAIDSGKLENIKLVELICSSKNIEDQKQLLQFSLSGHSFHEVNQLKKEIEKAQIKNREKRGRKKVKVNLGYVKPHLVKFIIETLATSSHLDKGTIDQISKIKNSTHWQDQVMAEQGFKKIISLFEEIGK